MRSLSAVLICLPFASLAQQAPQPGSPVFEGLIGACMVHDAQGTLTSAGTCKKLAPKCTPVDCALVFQWYTGSRTVITTTNGQTPFVNAGVLINGQAAQAPAALLQSDPRDCLYNEASGNTFCYVEGLDAFTEVGDEASTDLVRMKDIAASLPSGWRGDVPVAPGAPARADTATAPTQKAAPLLAPFEGVWKIDGSASCSSESDLRLEIAQGQARFHESLCALSQPRTATDFGAVEVLGLCSGEGEMWEEPMVLYRLEARLALLNTRTMAIYEACE